MNEFYTETILKSAGEPENILFYETEGEAGPKTEYALKREFNKWMLIQKVPVWVGRTKSTKYRPVRLLSNNETHVVQELTETGVHKKCSESLSKLLEEIVHKEAKK